MLRSEDPSVHYEAVGVIGNLVHSSTEIKQQVLQVRDTQERQTHVCSVPLPVLGIISSNHCWETPRALPCP